MQRRTKSIRQAVQRAAEILEPHGITVEKDGEGFRIIMEDKGPKRNAARTLALLADVAKWKEVDLSPIRWYGQVPTKGLSGWQVAALRDIQLKLD